MIYPKLIAGILLLLLQFLLGCGAAGGPKLDSIPSLTSATRNSAPGSDKYIADHQASDDEAILVKTDFSKGHGGWQAGAVGFDDEMSADVAFHGGWQAAPEIGRAFELRSTNVSAMVFMYVTRELNSADGLEPGRAYDITARARLISGASRECVGAGGSPGDVGVYAGFFDRAPEKYREPNGAWQLSPDPYADNDLFRFVSDIDNGRPCQPNLKDYVQVEKRLREPIRAVADASGRLHAVIGINGGFAGETQLFLQSIELSLRPL